MYCVKRNKKELVNGLKGHCSKRLCQRQQAAPFHDGIP